MQRLNPSTHRNRVLRSFFCVIIAAMLGTSILTLTPGVARAQTLSSSSRPQATSQEVTAVTPTRYSPLIAFLLPALGTTGSFMTTLYGGEKEIAPVYLVGVAGMLAGPSLGHFYTRDWKRALIPTGLRAAGLGIAIYGFLGGDFSSDSDVTRTNPYLAVGGLLLLVGSGVYSIVDAPRSARRGNRRSKTTMTLTMTRIPDADGNRVAGLSLTGRF